VLHVRVITKQSVYNYKPLLNSTNERVDLKNDIC
jgi:hypothetical protein